MLLLFLTLLFINKDKIIFKFIQDYLWSFRFFSKKNLLFMTIFFCILYGYFPDYFNTFLYFNFFLTIFIFFFEILRILILIIFSFFWKKKITIYFPIPISEFEKLPLLYLIIYDFLIFKLLSAWIFFYKLSHKSEVIWYDNVKILSLTLTIRLLGYPIFFLLNIIRIIDFILSCIVGSNLLEKDFRHWFSIVFYHFKKFYYLWIKRKNKSFISFCETNVIRVNTGRWRFESKNQEWLKLLFKD